MKPVGVVFVEIPDSSNKRAVISFVRKGMALVPEGRSLVVTYYMPQTWDTSIPIEGTVIRTVMGGPSERLENPEWGFFGNLGVRLCLGTGSQRKIRREMGVVILRRTGPKAYERRVDTPITVIEESRLPSLHPVFTRDVANNIWHLPVGGHVGRLRSRLSTLLAWSDEVAVIVSPGDAKPRRLRIETLDLDGDLIGVPTKHPYDWAATQGPIFVS